MWTVITNPLAPAGTPVLDHRALTYNDRDLARIYPWIVPHERQQQDLDSFPNLKRWFQAIQARQAVVSAYAKGEPWSSQPAVTEEGKQLLFGQNAASLGTAAE